jgi:hypothetical protein
LREGMRKSDGRRRVDEGLTKREGKKEGRRRE